METKTKLYLTAGCSLALLAGSLYLNAQARKRDKAAGVFFSEMERQLSPASVGLIESDAFNMYYWQNLSKNLKKSFFLLKGKAAQEFAKTIASAWGFFDDDEDKVYGVYRALKDKVQASQVAYQYYQLDNKKINLIDDLRARLSKDEVGEVMKIINKLPPYRLSEQTKS